MAARHTYLALERGRANADRLAGNQDPLAQVRGFFLVFCRSAASHAARWYAAFRGRAFLTLDITDVRQYTPGMGDKIRKTEGLRLLERAMAERSWNGSELARQLNTDSGLVSRWRNGQRVPDRASAVKIHALLGVPVDAWDRSPSKLSSRPAA